MSSQCVVVNLSVAPVCSLKYRILCYPDSGVRILDEPPKKRARIELKNSTNEPHCGRAKFTGYESFYQMPGFYNYVAHNKIGQNNYILTNKSTNLLVYGYIREYMNKNGNVLNMNAYGVNTILKYFSTKNRMVFDVRHPSVKDVPMSSYMFVDLHGITLKTRDDCGNNYNNNKKVKPRAPTIKISMKLNKTNCDGKPYGVSLGVIGFASNLIDQRDKNKRRYLTKEDFFQSVKNCQSFEEMKKIPVGFEVFKQKHLNEIGFESDKTNGYGIGLYQDFPKSMWDMMDYKDAFDFQGNLTKRLDYRIEFGQTTVIATINLGNETIKYECKEDYANGTSKIGYSHTSQLAKNMTYILCIGTKGHANDGKSVYQLRIEQIQ